MKVTSLLENERIASYLKNKHGLSLLIEFEGENILFDVGPDQSFMENALMLNKSLEHVKYIVLSHGHKDHTGGLPFILYENKKVQVYHMKDASRKLYSKQKDNTYKDISMPDANRDSSRFHLVEKTCKVNENIEILSVTHHEGFVPKANDNLYMMGDNGYVKDQFTHELILCIIENNELIVFTGCSHSGVGNMLKTVSDAYPDHPIKAVVGGMHLYSISNNTYESIEGISQLTQELQAYDCQYYTGHCTGIEAFKMLKGVLGDKIHPLDTGMVYEI